jgi:hypothetical protein
METEKGKDLRRGGIGEDPPRNGTVNATSIPTFSFFVFSVRCYYIFSHLEFEIL